MCIYIEREIQRDIVAYYVCMIRADIGVNVRKYVFTYVRTYVRNTFITYVISSPW